MAPRRAAVASRAAMPLKSTLSIAPPSTAPGPIYEYACHEGNYALEGILSGMRADEVAAEKAKAVGAKTAETPASQSVGKKQ